jgi:paraquat-inducible protein A
VLYRQSSLPLSGWVALVVAALILFIIANCFPIAVLNIKGLSVDATLPGALAMTWQQGHEAVAVMTGLFGFAAPLAQILFLLWALLAIVSRRLPADFRHGMRLLHAMSSWSMIPVLMLGILVAIVKLSDLATLTVGPALWAIAALAFLLTGLSRVSAYRLWRYAEDAGLVQESTADTSAGRIVGACSSCGHVQNLNSTAQPQPCRRCGAAVHFRKPEMVSRTCALIVAACILYIPANVLPVMQLRTPTGTSAHTILGGVIELWTLGSWDLAIVVFIASIVVPMTKLLILIALVVKHGWQGPVIQRQRTRLYEFIEFIGQWSMLDVFVVILLTAMADFPGITQVTAGPGAGSFGLVVVLTMFAAMSFDPRKGWDSQGSAAGDTHEPHSAVLERPHDASDFQSGDLMSKT